MPARKALLIGNSTFRHADLARLSAPANDVRELAALLEDPAIGGFTTELKLDVGLVDARKAIRRLFEDRHPDDLVLFYYSGHGLLDAYGRFYLAMTETDPQDPDAGSIDQTWLREVFDGSLSGRQVAILDCCHSGAFIPGEPPRKDAATGPILTEKTFDPTGHGRFIMAATTATSSAFEQEGRSLYTRHLVEGLTGGAAAPENDTVNIIDLHDFVGRRVAETAPASMRPQLWRDASLNPDSEHLTIARNPRPRPKLPEHEVSRLWSDDPEAIELAIFRLIEITRDEGDLAHDARQVLGERLNASDSLSYKLGQRISTFLGAGKTEMALADAQARLSEIEAEGLVAGAIHNALLKERDALRDELASAQGDIERVYQELNKLEIEAAKSRGENAAAIAQAESAKTHLYAAEKRIEEFEGSMSSLVAERDALRDELTSAQGDIERIKEKLTKLESETVSSVGARAEATWVYEGPRSKRNRIIPLYLFRGKLIFYIMLSLGTILFFSIPVLGIFNRNMAES